MIRIPKHLLNSDEDRELVGIISKDVIPFNSTSSNSHTRLDDIVGMVRTEATNICNQMNPK